MPDSSKFVFTSQQVEGALPNGTRVRKCAHEDGDAHKLGALATVIGSTGPIIFRGRNTIGYFVEWDDMPGIPVGVVDYKIEEVK